MEQLTREQAIAFHDSGAWREMTDRQRAAFQVEQDCLCMPFGTFHASVEAVLGRPVWTHEFGTSNRERLSREIAGVCGAPTLREILALLPKDKLLLVLA